MISKHIRLVTLIGTTALCCYAASTVYSQTAPTAAKAEKSTAILPGQPATQENVGPLEYTPPMVQPVTERESVAGKYLASHFAQNASDWRKANEFLGDVLAHDPDNSDLVRRSMILATGAGDMDLAADRAAQLLSVAGDDGLALMILSVHNLANDKVDASLDYLSRMKAGDMTDFVKPLLHGWAAAAKGDFNTEGFNETTIHRYHAALIAVMLDRKDDVKFYTEELMKLGALSNNDAERVGDLLAILGRYDEAKTLYEGIQQQGGDDKRIGDKLEAVVKGKDGNILALAEPLQIKNAKQGAARAMYDMAFILYQEHSDSSTKLFGQMALDLDPTMTDAHLILADTLSRNGRHREAIAQLEKIPADHPSYLAVQRHSAELLAETGRTEEALQKLDQLFKEHNDVEALIRIGDLHRNQENYQNALSAYNKAAKHIGATIPEEYWYLLYARGMAYEREGDWQKAESDLKAAMVYRPNHPYLLNYLGYGWADQGKNLEESLELIKRAVALQPADGYIIDSLGWVQYMMGQYAEALPNLEKAVELLPYDSTINDHLGDAYWQVGRKVEARFQWERARNYSEDVSFREQANHKLRYGLEGMDEVRHAETTTPADTLPGAKPQ